MVASAGDADAAFPPCLGGLLRPFLGFLIIGAQFVYHRLYTVVFERIAVVGKVALFGSVDVAYLKRVDAELFGHHVYNLLARRVALRRAVGSVRHAEGLVREPAARKAAEVWNVVRISDEADYLLLEVARGVRVRAVVDGVVEVERENFPALVACELDVRVARRAFAGEALRLLVGLRPGYRAFDDHFRRRYHRYRVMVHRSAEARARRNFYDAELLRRNSYRARHVYHAGPERLRLVVYRQHAVLVIVGLERPRLEH